MTGDGGRNVSTLPPHASTLRPCLATLQLVPLFQRLRNAVKLQRYGDQTGENDN
jgi:hypothetical protein